MAEYIADSYLGRLPNDYFSALDQQRYVPDVTGTVGEPIIGMKNLGIPTPPMQDQVQTLKQRIYQGASLVELGFTGAGKGSMGQGSTTPGMYGEQHRQAMRELAKANEIKLTTHVTTRMPPLSGFGQQGFSDEARRQALEEIERTVDFAADVSRGGPVTVHTGEFNRRVSKTPGGFTRYQDFEESTPEYFVDQRTGSFVEQVRPDEEVFWPEMERDENGNLKVDERGQFIPAFDVKKGGLNMRKITPEDIDDLKRYYEKNRNVQLTDEEAIARAKIESQLRNAEAWGLQTQARIEEERASLRDLEHQKSEMLEGWDRITPEERDRRTQMVLNTYMGGRVPPHMRGLSAPEILDKIIEREKTSMKYNQDVASTYFQQAENSKAVLDNLRTVEEFARDKTADTIARAAVYAMDKSAKNRYGERSRDPIFVSPENIFPDKYGSHPDELRTIVQSSRDRMAEHLVKERNLSEAEAKKRAAQHIKATFDIGHANMWKKYFKGNEKDFDSWMVKQAEKLAEEGIIGHVHVSDNLGYNDEHLSPGHGNAPIQDFVKRMKEKGLAEVIVEPAHNDFEVLTEGWRQLAGSVSQNFPIEGDRWVNIEHSYFGRTSGPYFLVGDMAPNQEAYQLWSGVRLE